MVPVWQLTPDEWSRLSHHFAQPPRPGRGRRGRPPAPPNQRVVEVCLYRFSHRHAARYRCLGWHELPRDLGVAPTTANRWFVRWSQDGTWDRFWDELGRLRCGPPPARPRTRRGSRSERSPVRAVLAELERGYAFLNRRFFLDLLPRHTIILIQHTRPRIAGHFLPRPWKIRGVPYASQITIAIGRLRCGPLPVYTTLLHEMVLLFNHWVGVPDGNPRGYHNRYFRDAAVVAGLECPRRDPRLGYSHTVLGKRALEAVTSLRPDPAVFSWKPEP